MQYSISIQFNTYSFNSILRFVQCSHSFIQFWGLGRVKLKRPSGPKSSRALICQAKRSNIQYRTYLSNSIFIHPIQSPFIQFNFYINSIQSEFIQFNPYLFNLIFEFIQFNPYLFNLIFTFVQFNFCINSIQSGFIQFNFDFYSI